MGGEGLPLGGEPGFLGSRERLVDGAEVLHERRAGRLDRVNGALFPLDLRLERPQPIGFRRAGPGRGRAAWRRGLKLLGCGWPGEVSVVRALFLADTLAREVDAFLAVLDDTLASLK